MAGAIFELPDEQVEVRYVKKQTELIKDKRHIAYGGLMEGAYITFVPKKLRDKDTYANVLTNAEKDYLEKILGISLSVYTKELNYWDKIKFRIGKEGIFLNLNDPEEYIKYKVLLTYTDIVCTSIEELDFKRSYRFVIVKKDDEAKQTLKKVDVTKEAYKLLGKIEDSREAMIDFLRVSNMRVTEDTSMEGLVALVSDILVKDTAKFVKTLKDPSYETRVLIHKAMQAGEIIKKGTYYYSKDNEPLSEPNTPATLENVVLYLENNLYQEYRLHLMAKTK
jgi:hypothetical protein